MAPPAGWNLAVLLSVAAAALCTREFLLSYRPNKYIE